MSVRSLRYNTIEQHFTKGVTASTDRDALAFLEAAQIYNTNQQRAIVNLVRSLKRVGLWSKMKAIYPFVGGTASSHKWNLKDPRDADAAFRLSFSGGWTHSANGILPNGTNAYADTFLNEANNIAANSGHISIYSRSDIDGLKCDIGVLQTAAIESSLFPKFGNVFYPRIQATNNGIANTVSSLGYFISNRVSVTEIRAFQNNVLKQITNTAQGRTSANYFISAFNRPTAGGTAFYSDRQLAFATIGDGLTDTDATNLYNIVDLYQKRLGRAV